MASKQDEFFKLHGADELQKELKALSRGMQNKIVRPGLRQGAAEIRKVAKRIAPKDTGLLSKSIKSKVFTNKTGAKGVVARVGVLSTDAVDKDGDPVIKYAGPIEEKTKFLEKATAQAQGIAIQKLLGVTQQKMDAFHASQPKASKNP
jgi:hypothetical protein